DVRSSTLPSRRRIYHAPIPGHHSDDGESSFNLLARARAGDAIALERLIARHLPRLRRWASGRLPARARDRGGTEDLVQETVVQSLRKIGPFEPTREGALQVYPRQPAMNRISDAIRRADRRPEATSIDETLPAADASPLERAIGRESLARYDAALASLKPAEQEAI